MEITQHQPYTAAPGYFRRLSAFDWLFGLVLLAGALFALNRYGAYMDVYEKAILLLAVPTFAALGWHWKPMRALMLGMTVLALGAIAMYDGDLAAA